MTARSLTHSAKVANVQRSLFLDLSEEEQKVIEILEKRGDLQINTLVVEADIPVQKMNTILFELEMKGVVRVLEKMVCPIGFFYVTVLTCNVI